MKGSKRAAKKRSTSPKSPPCPKCKGKKSIEIVYGMPSPEAQEDVRKGKLALGGCLIERDQPNWHCKSCDHDWMAD